MSDILIKILADGAIIPIIMIGVFVLVTKTPNNQKLEAYSRILMAGLTAYLLAKLVGSIYQPELVRPFEAEGVSAGASFLNNPGFPSDHILFCTAITLAVWFETHMKRLSLFLAGLTILVAIGRVAALVHTPLDIIGGVVIAWSGIPWYLQRGVPAFHTKTSSATRQKHKKPVK